MEKNKNSKNFNNSSWWQPSSVEKIMLWLTVVTVLVSVVSQASSIVSNLLQFDNIYRQLYPLLNIFHIYVLFYIIFSLRNIKQYIPAPSLSSKDDDKNNYNRFRKKIEQWIKGHFGEIYWDKWDIKDNDSKESKDNKKEKFDAYIDKLTKKTNRSIKKTHTYFMGVFGCFILLYIFELINSFTYSVNEPVLHILTMIFNNIATLFWFYIYLTFDITETTIEIRDKDRDDMKTKIEWKELFLIYKKVIRKKFTYKIVKWANGIWHKIIETINCICPKIIKTANAIRRTFALEEISLQHDNKFGLYEDNNEKYESIEIPRLWNWKFIGLVLLLASIGFFIYFIWYFKSEHILEIERLKDQTEYSYLWHYSCFRLLSTISILLGGCAMLATFSRLSSGFKRVPLAAFLIMIFYAALQPLFFAGDEFSTSNMKLGQMMFIANALCLLGKFGLLHLIKWFFRDYYIAYYFIAGQIVKDKKDDLKLEDLFEKTQTT